jgi:hypothetical protein
MLLDNQSWFRELRFENQRFVCVNSYLTNLIWVVFKYISGSTNYKLYKLHIIISNGYKQGDQIGRIFTFGAIVYFGQFFK